MITTELNLTKINKSPYLIRKNLELILGSNRRTLDYKIESMIKDKILIRIKPGFYISTDYLNSQTDTEEYLEYIGNILREPSYISLRYALFKYNLIPESIYEITYITTKKPAKFESSVKNFSYRNINEQLFDRYTTFTYKDKLVNIAYPYKALFDFFYYINFKSKDEIADFIETSRINWDNLDTKNKKLLEKILKLSNNKMSLILEVLKDRKIL